MLGTNLQRMRGTNNLSNYIYQRAHWFSNAKVVVERGTRACFICEHFRAVLVEVIHVAIKSSETLRLNSLPLTKPSVPVVCLGLSPTQAGLVWVLTPGIWPPGHRTPARRPFGVDQVKGRLGLCRSCPLKG